MANILLIDDPGAAAQTCAVLGAHGHDVAVEAGARAVQRVIWQEPDLVVLDVDLPVDTGFQVCEAVRAAGFDGPVVFLTARDGPDDELHAFQAGCDDFIRKPVDPRILLFRVDVPLRRRAPDVGLQRFEDDDLLLDPTSRRAVGNGRELRLTTGQFDLLWLLACNVGRVVTREVYYRQLRGIPYDGVDRSYDSRIRELRQKLASAALDQRIVTVRGAGYQLAPR